MRYAVIGCAFGDEGKGLFTDYLCNKSNNPLVVRYSGGHQAGHTVYYNGISHVFSNFGSGTLRGVPTFWSKTCTFDPVGTVNEYFSLIEKGITPTLYVDKLCPVTTPYDIIHNRNSSSMDHGTCGVGVGATFQREEDFYSLTASDLYSDTILNIKLPLIREYYKNELSNDILNKFVDSIHFIRNCDNIVLAKDSFVSENYFDWNGDIIFEGSQGLLLDQNIGFFPHVTRSNTGTRNIQEYNPKVFYITRAYQNRHGNGPMTNTQYTHNIMVNPDETNVTNEFQGVFKRSLLDLDLLKYAIEKDAYKKDDFSLVITCLDHIENEYRFTYKGDFFCCDNDGDFVKKISTILNIHNVYLSRSPYSDGIEFLKM